MSYSADMLENKNAEQKEQKMQTVELTGESLALFVAFAKDSGNWGGMPMIGGNVGTKESAKRDRGNITDLKRKGLITTCRDEGCDFVCFTQLGIEFAKQIGITIHI